MKLELTEGCDCSSFEADGEPIHKMSTEDIKDIVRKQVDVALQTDEWNTLYALAYWMMQNFYDLYESSGPCECCGDYVETYTMEI